MESTLNYVIVQTLTITELQDKVNAYDRDGWHPIGGMTAIRQGMSGPHNYFQAVYKNNSSPIAHPNMRMSGEMPGAKKRGRPVGWRKHRDISPSK